MRIWTKPISIEILTGIHADTAVQRLGIEFTEVGDDFIRARVPVNGHTRQPYGLLHGGVSVVLAETLGSCGAAYSCEPGHRAVGLDINANHLRGATSGCRAMLSRAAAPMRPKPSPAPRMVMAMPMPAHSVGCVNARQRPW